VDAHTKTRKPAALGGTPLFQEPLGIVRPQFPDLSTIAEPVQEILRTGQLTNLWKNVPVFETQLREYLDVDHCVCVGNGTLGLILALDGLGLDGGEVITTSFTYSATAHVLYWVNMQPVFVDIEPDTFNIDPAAVEAAITSETVAILAVHVYGHPCDVHALQRIADRHNLALIYDSAHAFATSVNGQMIGNFGDAEVFSFHATKIFPVGEGGAVTTSNSQIARHIDLARKFGDSGSGDTEFFGMNAKMQEFNAIIGMENLKLIDQYVKNRAQYAAVLTERLTQLPGISTQQIRPNVTVNFQNYAILIDEQEFGLSRDQVFDMLKADNIFTRKYFYPPLHRHQSYLEISRGGINSLALTEIIAEQVLCLPMYSVMTEEEIDKICLALESLHFYSQ